MAAFTPQQTQQAAQIVTVQRQESVSPSGQTIITTTTTALPYSDNSLQLPIGNPVLNGGSVQELRRFQDVGREQYNQTSIPS
jgi:hypothetical protein